MKSHSLIRQYACIASILMFCSASTSTWAQELSKPTEANNVSATQIEHGLDPEIPLIQRVGETPDSVIAFFHEAGMSPKSYSLNDDDRQKLIEAFAILPPLHQEVLKQRLRSISFLNDMPNTALTSTVNPNEAEPLFDIAIRAAILNQSAAEWMTEKESSCFDAQESAFALRVHIGNITAIQYVFLHEATHIVDATRHITPSLGSTGESVLPGAATPFTAGVWEDAKTPVSRYRDEGLMAIRFRQGGKVMDSSNMKSLYEALGRTPFVSLYGSSARTEDLAEYVTVYHLTQRLHQPFRISVFDGDREVLVHDPMASEVTRSRFESIKPFYELAAGKPSQGK